MEGGDVRSMLYLLDDVSYPEYNLIIAMVEANSIYEEDLGDDSV